MPSGTEEVPRHIGFGCTILRYRLAVGSSLILQDQTMEEPSAIGGSHVVQRSGATQGRHRHLQPLHRPSVGVEAGSVADQRCFSAPAMKPDSFENKSPEPFYWAKRQNIVRRRRLFQLLALYWLGILFIGLSLPRSEQLRDFEPFALMLIGSLRGVVRIAAASFDATFAHVFLAFALTWAAALTLFGCFWLPRGSEKVFRSVRYKVAAVFVASVALAVVFGTMWNTYLPIDPAEGRYGALLHLRISSKWGLVSIMGTFYGLSQLFITLVFRAVLTSATIKN